MKAIELIQRDIDEAYKTLVAAKQEIEWYICSCVPSKTRPHPAEKSVSPQNRTSSL